MSNIRFSLFFLLVCAFISSRLMGGEKNSGVKKTLFNNRIWSPEDENRNPPDSPKKTNPSSTNKEKTILQTPPEKTEKEKNNSSEEKKFENNQGTTKHPQQDENKLEEITGPPPDSDKKKVNEEDLRGKSDEVSPATKDVEKVSIVLSKNQVKPGGYVLFRINIPKSYAQSKIQTFNCSANLTPNRAQNGRFGTLIADTVAGRNEKAYITVTVSDQASGKYETVKKTLIISSSEEFKLGLKIKTRMITGKTYPFVIIVPSGFKPPYSVYMKFASCVEGNYQIQSLSGNVIATAKKMSSGSISAKVYDNEGHVGYVRKTITVEPPAEGSEDQLPMEEAPTILEEVLDATVDGLKDAAEAGRSITP